MPFRDRICLAVDGSDLGKVQGIARDMRSCTTTIKLGPAFMIAHGAAGIRSLREMGVTDIIIDTRVFGCQAEVWSSVVEAAKLGAYAVTVNSFVGPRLFSLAIQAAIYSMEETHRVKPPLVVGAAVPAEITSKDLFRCYGTRHLRRTCLEKHAKLCHEAGGAAVVVAYSEMAHVRKACEKLPMLVPVRRRVYGYDEVLPEGEKNKPCVAETLRKGASMAIYDMSLVGRDAEWTADMLNKELAHMDDVK